VVNHAVTEAGIGDPSWEIAVERTLLIIKPDALQRRLAGRIVTRFEEKGFQIVALKLTRIPEGVIRRHYAAHEGKPFYEPLVRYMSGAPVLLVVARAKNAIAVARKLMGATFGANAEPGTIRGDFAVSNRFNLIHGSDSPEAAEREIALFFKPEELHEVADPQEGSIYDLSTGERV
jgi:nucleoside-diphosphate kinase